MAEPPFVMKAVFWASEHVHMAEPPMPMRLMTRSWASLGNVPLPVGEGLHAQCLSLQVLQPGWAHAHITQHSRSSAAACCYIALHARAPVSYL